MQTRGSHTSTRTLPPSCTQPSTTPPDDVFLIAFDTRLETALLKSDRSVSMDDGELRRLANLKSIPCKRAVSRYCSKTSVNRSCVLTDARRGTYDPSSL